MLTKLAVIAAVAVATVTVAGPPAVAAESTPQCITCWPVTGVGRL